MEIVFSVIAFLLILIVIVAIFLALRGRVPRMMAVILLSLAVVEVAIWFGVPQFPRRMATASRTNIAETNPDPEFPELRTRVYRATPDRVLEAAATAIASRPGKWAIVSSDAATGRMHATTRVLMFTDDVFVDVRRQETGVRVNVRSQSRVGKGDFGENRRHVAWLLENLDRRLQ